MESKGSVLSLTDQSAIGRAKLLGEGPRLRCLLDPALESRSEVVGSRCGPCPLKYPV